MKLVALTTPLTLRRLIIWAAKLNGRNQLDVHTLFVGGQERANQLPFVITA